ncbi:radical SAM protein [uncultured Algimonas sp.]|uniref:radical SAM protein n=1 Tax=uncultured Algimonas sp. TaxID=1547920 RepID=UPI002617FF90|nr:radical SAM protein [uncultured Algimonas sp.]
MNAPIDPAKFRDPLITAQGDVRASVAFRGYDTLWFNTGSLCNIECANCYIESSPTADHFVYLTPGDVAPFLDELEAPIEIGFTGGEPFLNPHMIRLSEMALERGHRILILTNAMRPMMRPRVQAGLLDLKARFPARVTMRVSLDHYTAEGHDAERGAGAFAKALPGVDWLAAQGFALHIAGRAVFADSEVSARSGYRALVADRGWPVDADDPAALMLFPEMDDRADVPEITTACWDILSVSPDSLMCANSRMVVRRKGEGRARVLACTLLWDDPQFDMGATLDEAARTVSLNHPHCATFCVLGGASCSA